MNEKSIRVAAAVILDQGRLFATQRGYGEYKDWWEFPGGKLEPGETPEEALRREIREELDMEIRIEEHLMTVEYDYPKFHLSMECFLCSPEGQTPRLLEHEAARWLLPEEYEQVHWLPADDEVLKRLKSRAAEAELTALKEAAAETNGQLLTFLEGSPDAFHTVARVRDMLTAGGYAELPEYSAWQLEEGGKYFVTRNGSSLIAFRLPRKDFGGYMIAAAHTDSPTFKLKEDPEIKSSGYVKLNVEGYGGMLMSPWLDRPLSVSGRLVVREDGRIVTKLVKAEEDLLMIPNLAIHMDREVNNGRKFSIQGDLLPVYGDEEDAGTFLRHLAEAAGVSEADVLSHDLFLYLREAGRIWGARKQYLSAPRLDDLQCAFGCLKGFLAAEEEPAEGPAPEQANAAGTPVSLPVLALFDNEEVGSGTKQGADSTFLQDVLRRIALAAGKSEEAYLAAVAASFMVSADNAHALHPAHPEKADPVNRPKMNGGIVIKYSANQKYTSDAVSAAVFKEICRLARVPWQVFTNHSDVKGGSTLGNIVSSHVSLNTVDIGLPQLAMHSCYETAGTLDTEYLIRAMKLFFTRSLVWGPEGCRLA